MLSLVRQNESRSEKLFKIALELNPALTPEKFKMLMERETLAAKLNNILAVREAEEAARKKEEEQRALDEEANALEKKLNSVLNPVKPKEPVVLLTRKKIAEMAPAQPPSLEERIDAQKQKHGTKVPEKIFSYSTHEYVMGLRGAMIGVKIGFERDKQKRVNDEEAHVAYQKKCDSVQRFIDILTEIVKVGYQLDPNDKKNHAGQHVYREVLALLQTDIRLKEHCKLPETKAEREAREKHEQELQQQAQQAEEQRLAERKKMVNEIIDRMKMVELFAKMSDDARIQIAERIARKFSGASPESRLKQAAREKCGGDVKAANRLLGIALARAGRCTEDEVNAMFPSPKQQNGKKQKKNKR